MNKLYTSLASLPCLIGSLAAADSVESSPRTEEGCQRFFLSADFLYWNVRQDGLEYAALGLTAAALPLFPGKVYRPNFEWDSGFKVGAGVHLPHDGWDLFANYTWIRSHAHISTGPAAPYPIELVIFLGLNGLVGGSQLFGSNEHWSFRFNNLDFELGREIPLSMCFLIRPYFGCKGSWQDNDLKAAFDTSSIGTFQDHRKNDLWGVGPRGGLYAEWSFVQSWGIYGNFALSSLWTHNKASRKSTIDSDEILILNMHETIQSITPVIEMSLGVSYSTGISHDRYRFSLNLGWELQDWINYNELIALVQVGSKGDLILQGLTAGARFDF